MVIDSNFATFFKLYVAAEGRDEQVSVCILSWMINIYFK